MRTIDQILKLSVTERIAAIEKIWNSIDASEIRLSDAQKKELDKRLSRIETGETKFYSWTEVKKKLHGIRK